jgi:hypothetical protein
MELNALSRVETVSASRSNALSGPARFVLIACLPEKSVCWQSSALTRRRWGIAFRVDGLKRQRRHEPLKAAVAIARRGPAL